MFFRPLGRKQPNAKLVALMGAFYNLHSMTIKKDTMELREGEGDVYTPGPGIRGVGRARL